MKRLSCCLLVLSITSLYVVLDCSEYQLKQSKRALKLARNESLRTYQNTEQSEISTTLETLYRRYPRKFSRLNTNNDVQTDDFGYMPIYHGRKSKTYRD